ncbi:RNA 2',3'-cyclic phosphodiesterase [Paenibacillus massiliensis]|uniref:RNA 2',3'-cyclic phosphodiesterase n=1 Tax=Paenibacillus massiliensis TaxID=225917 RepID=UPI000470F31D|nr:RNA 2',3'-cyclic phosphodiesterase [Paenibacillus massiliensis]
MTPPNKGAASQERIFIAVPLPDSLKEQLHEWAEILRSEVSFRKWTDWRDYHITLQFLGDTDTARIADLVLALKRSTDDLVPFQLKLGAVGTFGTTDRPRVLWQDVEGEVDHLYRLQERIVDATEPLGFQREARAYHPHITIARNYTGTAAFQHSEDTNLPLINSTWKVESFVVYATQLGLRPMYRVVGEIPIKGSETC